MSASKERRTRKVRNGGVLDTCPDNVTVQASFTLNGEKFYELIDGRICRVPVPKLDFHIVNGRVVRG